MKRIFATIPAIALWGMALAVCASAAEDVRGITLPQQGLKVVEEKCLVCHNRKRIDEAVQKRQEMAKIMRRMEQKGVRLTERDRMVIGHFWNQSPFQKQGGTPLPASPPDVPLK
ncbi:hypothetical protein GURASL_02480 [Geotalea uraniireducens]|uniref:Cytochrome c n=1 Tax=Geotalea uraniireducens TaxID=351604 RepID=A0ABN6VTH0_9BACT|nr:hypothetical protein [Geotalea uraniireducens]BDV41325.1 hypothetical protein GURASL_02480 [Geotalea uraniireducens]